jgi:hypothetical protein
MDFTLKDKERAFVHQLQSTLEAVDLAASSGSSSSGHQRASTTRLS